MTLKELREKRAAALQKAEALADAENFDQSAFDAAVKEVKALDARIQAKQEVAEADARAEAENRAVAEDADRRNVSLDEAANDAETWLGALGAWAREADPTNGVTMSDDQRMAL